jgi:hypothetical protein
VDDEADGFYPFKRACDPDPVISPGAFCDTGLMRAAAPPFRRVGIAMASASFLG